VGIRQYLNLELDLSGTIIFTTTNDYKTLKPALKSRIMNIEIKPPTPKQMQFIVQNIYETSLLDMKLQHYFKKELSLKLSSTLCDFSPREVIEVIRLAIGKACVRANQIQRVELMIEDLELSNVSQCVEHTNLKHVEGNMH
jgi:ATP-dependent Lon protease